MKRIQISFIIDRSQHWLFYSYVEQAAPISTTNDSKFQSCEGAATSPTITQGTVILELREGIEKRDFSLSTPPSTPSFSNCLIPLRIFPFPPCMLIPTQGAQ
jgi:hypothetical protein